MGPGGGPPPGYGPPGMGPGGGGHPPGQGPGPGPGLGRGQSPPSFPGLMPTSGRVTIPRGFTPPRESSPPSDSAEDIDLDVSTANAIREWEEIRQAFEVFRARLGPDFEPLGPDVVSPEMTPFGPALTYRTYSIAGIWMSYYMGLIVLHRAHPSMPPVAVIAAGMAAQQTGRWANEIARICAGLHEDTTHVATTSTLVGAAFIESCFPLFVAGVQVCCSLTPHPLLTTHCATNTFFPPLSSSASSPNGTGPSGGSATSRGSRGSNRRGRSPKGASPAGTRPPSSGAARPTTARPSWARCSRTRCGTGRAASTAASWSSRPPASGGSCWPSRSRRTMRWACWAWSRIWIRWGLVMGRGRGRVVVVWVGGRVKGRRMGKGGDVELDNSLRYPEIPRSLLSGGADELRR